MLVAYVRKHSNKNKEPILQFEIDYGHTVLRSHPVQLDNSNLQQLSLEITAVLNQVLGAMQHQEEV